MSFLGHVGSVSLAFGLEFVFLLSLLRGGRTQPEPQGQSSHVTLPLGSWQGSLLCFCCLHKVQCALQGRKMALGSPSTIGRCQGQRGTGVLSCDGASAVTTSSEVSTSAAAGTRNELSASGRPGVFSYHGRVGVNSRFQGHQACAGGRGSLWKSSILRAVGPSWQA